MASSSIPRTLLVNNLVYQHFLVLAGLTEDYETVGEIIRHLIENYQFNAEQETVDTQLILVMQRWAKKFPDSEPLRITEVYKVLERVERRLANLARENQIELPKPELRSIDGGVSRDKAPAEQGECLPIEARRKNAGLRIIPGGSAVSGNADWSVDF